MFEDHAWLETMGKTAHTLIHLECSRLGWHVWTSTVHRIRCLCACLPAGGAISQTCEFLRLGSDSFVAGLLLCCGFFLSSALFLPSFQVPNTRQERKKDRGERGDNHQTTSCQLGVSSSLGPVGFSLSGYFSLHMTTYKPQPTTTNHQPTIHPNSWHPSIYIPSEESPGFQMSDTCRNQLQLEKSRPCQSTRQIIVSCCGQAEAAPCPTPHIKTKPHSYNISVFKETNYSGASSDL